MQLVLKPKEVFRGERLQVAREFKGFTQKELGSLLGISNALISDLENSKKLSLSDELIPKLESALGFSRSFYYQKIEDPFLEDECNFRHRRSTPEKIKTQVRAHATLLGLVLARLRQIFEFPVLSVPSFPAHSDDEIEAAAEACRASWGIDSQGPILQVGRALERAGVVIIKGVVDTSKVDAFSRLGSSSLIFLNVGRNTSATRLNFDIAHECGHLVMHQGIPTGNIDTEAEADKFASAFLLPRQAFSREFRTRAFTWQNILELKMRWRVSAAAIIRRAKDLGLMEELAYRRAYQQMSAKGWTKGEPNEPPFHEPELFSAALAALGSDALPTLEELASELGFANSSIYEITGLTHLATST